MAKYKQNQAGLIFMLAFGWFAVWTFRTVLSPIYSVVGADLGVTSSAQLGLISSCYFLGYVGMQIPGGLLADRFGRWNVVVPGFSLFFVGTIVVATAHSLGAIYAGSVMAGLGTGTFYSSVFSLTAEKIPPKKKTVSTAFVNMGCALGMVAGYMISSTLVNRFGTSWRVPSTIAVVLALLSVLILAFGLERNKGKALEKKEKMDLRVVLTPPILTTCIFYFGTNYGYYMIVTWLPSFLQSERGFSAGVAGLVSSIVPLASIPGAFFFSALADKFGSKRKVLLATMQAGSAVLLIIAAITRNAPLTIGCFVFYGLIGKMAEDPMIVLNVSDRLDKSCMASGLAIYNCIGMSASIFAPTVSGLVADMTGNISAGFYVAIVLLLVTSLIFWIGNRKY